MAATGRSASVIMAAMMLAIPVRGDRAADVRERITYLASALTAGNAADAMTLFDKSFAKYDALRNYFQGLGAFQVENEVDITDEKDTDTETTLVVAWILTLTDLASDSKEERSGEINVRLVSKGGKWKIADLTPIELFNPQKKKH